MVAADVPSWPVNNLILWMRRIMLRWRSLVHRHKRKKSKFSRRYKIYLVLNLNSFLWSNGSRAFNSSWELGFDYRTGWIQFRKKSCEYTWTDEWRRTNSSGNFHSLPWCFTSLWSLWFSAIARTNESSYKDQASIWTFIDMVVFSTISEHAMSAPISTFKSRTFTISSANNSIVICESYKKEVSLTDLGAEFSRPAICGSD